MLAQRVTITRVENGWVVMMFNAGVTQTHVVQNHDGLARELALVDWVTWRDDEEEDL